MSFRFEKKSYGWRDLFLLPCQCAPKYVIYMIGQKLLTGIGCVIMILLEADLVDKLCLFRIKEADWHTVLPDMLGIVAIIIWKRMGYNVGRIFTVKAQGEIEYQFQKELVRKCSRVSYRLLEDRTFQNLKTYLEQNVFFVMWNIMQQTGNFLLILVRLIGVYLLIMKESVSLVALMVFVTLPVIFFSVRNEKKAEQILDSDMENRRKIKYLSGVLQSRKNVEERTLFHYTDYLNDNCEREYKKHGILTMQGIWQRCGSAVSESVVLNVSFTLVVIAMTAFLAQGKMSFGMYIALTAGVYDVLRLMYHGMDFTIMEMERGMYFLNRLSAMADMPETEGVNELPAQEKFVFDELEFINVSFRYPRTAKYVLKSINLKLKSGIHYAFVGENGAGKTTIANLLLGIYDSYEGRIQVNGKELRDYTAKERKAIFAAIYQDSPKYEETVAVNIGMGNVRELEREDSVGRYRKEVETAAGKIGIAEDIRRLPQGFDTMLGAGTDKGVVLAEGQWKKLMFARLLVNPAPVCILDEPAAGLDSVTESRLYEQTEEISREKTMLFISHRLGAVKQADRIFVLKEGTIAEEGTHEELMQRKGIYTEMYERQSQWYR